MWIYIKINAKKVHDLLTDSIILDRNALKELLHSRTISSKIQLFAVCGKARIYGLFLFAIVYN